VAAGAGEYWGRWEVAGQQDLLPCRGIPCDVFRWYAPGYAGGGTIEFLVPQGEKPRRFFAADWLSELTKKPHGRKGNPAAGTSRFADRVARLGVPVLARLEAELRPDAAVPDPGNRSECWQPPASLYEFFLAIFARRLDGHYAVRRGFTTRKDLLDLSQRGATHRALLPQMLDQGTLPVRASEIIRRVQDVVFERQANGPADRPARYPVHLLPGRNAIDALIIQGADHPGGDATVAGLWNRLTSAVIDGYELLDDGPVTPEQEAGYSTFVRAMLRAYLEKTPEEFGRWFRVEREKGFRRLHDGGGMPGGAAFRHLLWTAHVQAGRCFGAGMLAAGMALLEVDSLAITATEASVFREMHLPLFMLAGLPVEFLDWPQLRFAVRPLLERFWGGRGVSADERLAMAELLGLFGELNAARRRTDRDRHTPGVSSPTRLDAGIEPAGAAVDKELDFDQVPISTSRACPKCGGDTDMTSKPTWVGQQCVVQVECPRCQYQGTARFDFSMKPPRHGSVE